MAEPLVKRQKQMPIQRTIIAVIYPDCSEMVAFIENAKECDTINHVIHMAAYKMNVHWSSYHYYFEGIKLNRMNGIDHYGIFYNKVAKIHAVRVSPFAEDDELNFCN